MTTPSVFATTFADLVPALLAAPLEACTGDERSALLRLVDLRAALLRTRRQITFFGTVKAGKSTLVNALLGQAVLPSGANRTTGVPTAIQHGPTLAATVLLSDDAGNQQRRPVPVEALHSFVKLDLSTGHSVHRQEVAEITITMPVPLLARRCRLVDTPGLRDNHLLDASVRQVLEASDLAVIVLNATQILSEDEKHEAYAVQQLLDGNLVFAITRLEQLNPAEREEVREWVSIYLDEDMYGNEIVGQRRFFPVYTMSALHGPTDEESRAGVAALAGWLGDLLDSPTGDRMAIRSRLSVLTAQLIETLQFFERRLAASRQELRAQEQAATLSEARARERFADQIRDVELDLFRLRDHLDLFINRFADGVVERIVAEAQQTPFWGARLPGCLSDEVEAYRQRIANATSSIVAAHLADYPAFTPSGHLIIQPMMQAIDSEQITPGSLRDTLVRKAELASQGTRDWLVGQLALAGERNPLKQMGSLGRLNAPAAGEEVRRQLSAVLPQLRAMTEQYLDVIAALLVDLRNRPPLAPNAAALREAQAQTDRHTTVVAWCQRLLDQIADLRARNGI